MLTEPHYSCSLVYIGGVTLRNVCSADHHISSQPSGHTGAVTLTAADVTVRPVTPTIGAEVIGVDLGTAPDDEQVMRRIEQALYDHLVLFFRDQDITDEQQVRFAGWFGPYEQHPFAKHDPDHPNMTVLDQMTPQDDGAN